MKKVSIAPASRRDVSTIAELSRRLIESGLGWSWTPARVAKSIAHYRTHVVVARIESRFAGFGIMRYYRQRANLNLLAVEPGRQRRGVGTELVKWLETAALDAGIENIYVQVRQKNHGARDFYVKLGYEVIDVTNRYYGNTEPAVIMYHYLCGPEPDA